MTSDQPASCPDVDVDPENRRLLKLLNAAVREAVLKHKQAGVPIVVWENGQVVCIPPEEIKVDDPEEEEGC